MARPRVKTFVNFSDVERKRRFLTWVGTLKDEYEVDLQPRRATRTLAQNRLWWSQVVEPFYEFLREQDYEIIDPEQAHSILKEKFLRVAVINKETGEELGYRTKSTTELSVEEFSALVESSATWLADQFSIVILRERL